MACAYIYLALIPTIIAIAILNSNENIQQKYDVKKALKKLRTQFITMTVLFSWFIVSRCYIFSKISSKPWPLSFFLFVFGLGILYPIFILNRSKLNRKKDILDEKWFYFVIVALLIVFMVFAPGFILRNLI